VDQYLRLCRCRDDSLFVSVLGATLHLGNANEDIVHAVTHTLFPRLRSMLANADRYEYLNI
jgi:hypothetical protein